MVRFTVKALALVVALVGAADAQETTQAGTAAQPTTGTVDQLIEKVSILTRASVRTAVPENEPQPIDLSLVEVTGIPKSLTQGVTAKAYTRFVSVDGQKVGQVVLTGVEKDGRAESLNSTEFSAQFNLQTAELDPSQPIKIEGNKNELKAALEKLAEQQVVEEKTEEKQSDEAGDPTRSTQPGSNSRENVDAAAYQNPEELNVQEAAPPVVKVTTEGCTIRVDTAQGFAIQQSRVETTEDGTVSSSTCEDSEVRFPLTKSYSVCSDAVDIEALKARAQFVLYYTDAGGARQEVTECAPDPELVFDIVENRESCTVFLDYSTLQAVTQAALVYRNANNADVQVRGCQASAEVASVPLVPTTDGCTIRHDFGGARSYQQGRHTYTINGVTWQAGVCSDNGTEFAHTKVYQNEAGAKICSPIVDQAGGNVTLQYRVAITKDSLVEYISECKPDASSTALIATTDGCTNPYTWNHDVSAGVSYGMERYFYMFNAAKEYVTSCQQSETTYAHQVEAAGWEPHDDQLFAYQKSTVFITAPSGRYNVVTSEVLDGAPQSAYVFESEGTSATGEYYYEACSRFEKVNNVEKYTRPDGTLYSKPIGEGTPLGPVHDCQNVIAASWPKVSQSGLTTNYRYAYVNSNESCPNLSGGGNSRYYSGTWSASKKVVRGDGELISTDTRTYSATCSSPTGTTQSGTYSGGTGGSGTSYTGCSSGNCKFCYIYSESISWQGAGPSCEATLDFNEDESAVMSSAAASWGWTGQTYRFE